jgi:hypothetical protein
MSGPARRSNRSRTPRSIWNPSRACCDESPAELLQEALDGPAVVQSTAGAVVEVQEEPGGVGGRGLGVVRV